MKNGTSQAVLVSDLLSGEGPHLGIAEAFVMQECSMCSAPVGEDAEFAADGYLCDACTSLFVA